MAILIVILGGTAIITMPVDIFPYIDIPIVSVLWQYSGLSPDEMEKRVVTNFERNLTSNVNDIEHKYIVDLILKVKAQCYTFEAANVRHEHEYHVWEDVKLPEGRIIGPGVVAHATDLVEHPEVVAERLVNYARLVGRENVQTNTDCGIGSRVGHEEVVWAKLRTMAEGARIASERLWAR